jgi:hypothetical protein
MAMAWWISTDEFPAGIVFSRWMVLGNYGDLEFQGCIEQVLFVLLDCM